MHFPREFRCTINGHITAMQQASFAAIPIHDQPALGRTKLEDGPKNTLRPLAVAGWE